MARPAEASDDLLAQLVDQFSDPFAFFRELIQNSIDAGSTRVEVTVRYAPGSRGKKGLATAQVADWGEGMNRTIIEKFLLTKFRSSKEDDLTKIGKFGIGFMSVFAPRPELVVLDTSRDGEDWRLLFKADRSYELLKCPEPIEGTRVALHKEMDAAAYAVFAAKSGEAVRLWCRHSEVEVGFAAGAPDGSPPPAAEPVRQSFHVDAPFEVELVEEGTQIVAGVARSSPPFCGFYNRGLTLLEVQEELVPGVTFKIASRWLEHTLTRDNVRRDKNFGKAMALVKKLAEGPLKKRLQEELKAAAATPKLPDYALLLRHAARMLSPSELSFPLLAGGVIDGSALKKAAKKLGFALEASASDPLVEAVGAMGIPILREVKGDAGFKALEIAARDVHGSFNLAVPCDGEAEKRLALALQKILSPAGLVPKKVIVARLFGLDSAQLATLVTSPGTPEPAGQALSPFKEGGKKVLCFNASHPQVASALKLCQRSPQLAALLCARLLAIGWNALGDKADARMTDAALAREEG